MPFAAIIAAIDPWIIAVALIISASTIGWITVFGVKRSLRMASTKRDVISMVEARHELLCEINKQLDNSNWFTKWRIRKKLEKKGLYNPKK